MGNSQESDDANSSNDSPVFEKTTVHEDRDAASPLLDKIERGVAYVMTAFLIVSHFTLAISSGGLWRDEVNTVVMAHLPLSALWKNLQFDSFPLLWFLVLRFWDAIGLGNDDGYRLLGCLVGVLLAGALWFSARQFKSSPPLFSLLLLAANPVIFFWGDSMRAYGFGMVMAIFMVGFIWRMVQTPTTLNIVLAAVFSVLSVHSIYYNAVLLVAFCCGGLAVAWRRRTWKTAMALCLIGALAAMSLLPYVAMFKEAAGWAELVRMPKGACTLSWLWTKLSATLGSRFVFDSDLSVNVRVFAWVILFFVALGLGIVCQKLPRFLCTGSQQRDVALFAVTALLVGVLVYFGFLKALRYMTQHWYYFALLALLAVLIDTLLGLLKTSRAGKITRLSMVLILTLTLGKTWSHAHDRFTNVDLMADYLNKNAEKGDLVILDWWFRGITFHRYYHGSATWTTIPPIGFYDFHRYDLIKKEMMRDPQTDVVRPIIDSVKETLRAGKKVWIVGGNDLFTVTESRTLPPMATTNQEWSDPGYSASWLSQVGIYLQQHSQTNFPVLAPHLPPNHLWERSGLLVATGWKE